MTTQLGLRDLLEQLNLHVNEPEPAIICRACQFGLHGTVKSITDHVVEKHNHSPHVTKQLRELLKPYTILSPTQLALRPDHSPPHPHLAIHLGNACKHCGYKTTSTELMGRHLSSKHNVKRKASTWLQDHTQQGLALQCWDYSGASGYWIVKSNSATEIRSSTDSSLDQTSTPRLQRLEQLHIEELEHITRRGTAVANDRESTDMTVNTNWMRRTGWAETFADAVRQLLVQLTQLPRIATQDLYLGDYGTIEICSSREDEYRLSLLVAAVDRVFDRCEETVRHTDGSIRCLLRSSYPDRTYKMPFELVGRKATTGGYRRIFKKAVCFCVRFWRLETSTRQKLLGRALTPSQENSLLELWSDEIWSSMPRAQQREQNQTHVKVNLMDEWELGSDYESDDSASVTTIDVDELDSHETLSENTSAPIVPKEKDEPERPVVEWLRRHASKKATSSAMVTDEDGTGPSRECSTNWITAIEDVLLGFLHFLSTEEYENGKPSSTLLIYFSGILALSQDGSTYERPANYTSKLSAMIYCIRLIVLEATLPQFSHGRLGWSARPHRGQAVLLNEVRRDSLCLGSPTPMNELLSLRDYGRVIGRSDGLSFRVTWSEDGETVAWDKHNMSMAQFRRIAHDTNEATEKVCRQLMYGWSPQVDLGSIRDHMSNVRAGYSFVTDSQNGLSAAYMELSRRASLATVDGLMTDDDWDLRRVRRYLDLYSELTEFLMLSIYLHGGQAPRGTELSALQHSNGSSMSRGVCVYGRKMVLIYRHAKSRRTTNHEFYVVRFLPDEVGRLLYYYLVYIRPFACMLHRVCWGNDVDSTLLFSAPAAPKEPMKTYVLSKVLARQTTATVGFPLSVKTYRQLSIAVTEKHVRPILTPFNRNDDRSKDADLSVALAWQSGHRPLQRGISYGIDGAFPDTLQPALLRVYEWASSEWHKFLQLPRRGPGRLAGKNHGQKREAPESIPEEPTKRRQISPPRTDAEMSTQLHEQGLPRSEQRETEKGPWVQAVEALHYKNALKDLWPGAVPIFGQPSRLESDRLIQERETIIAHLKSQEAESNHHFQSRRRLHNIDKAFVRWRNVGCQLCYANSGEKEPDHDMEHCVGHKGSKKAQEILTWLNKLKLPRHAGSCSLCSMTEFPCADIIAGHNRSEAEHDDVRNYWDTRIQKSLRGDGACQIKPVVKRTIAALCAFDEQVLGAALMQRLRDENGVDIRAMNHVQFWF
jgi:hypothetical protein